MNRGSSKKERMRLMSPFSMALSVADSAVGGKSSLFWPLKCFPGVFRKTHRGQADVNTNSWQQGTRMLICIQIETCCFTLN